MRHYSKSHGSHCYLRSFKTFCPNCGVDVLYWECTHGSKVFFNYPPYGRLQRHYCRRDKALSRKTTFHVIVKTPKGLLEEPFITCPICGSIFKEEIALKNHLKSMRTQDNEHKLFFHNEMVFENGQKKGRFSQFEDNRFKQYPKFGRINFKKEKKG